MSISLSCPCWFRYVNVWDGTHISREMRVLSLAVNIWQKGISLRQVAPKLGLKYAGLQWYIRRFNILVRDRVESMNLVFNGHGPNWKGGKILVKGSKRGTQYIMLKDRKHPDADKRGYVFEHRAVMAAFVGHPHHRDQIVHHVNGDTLDNRIENLELRLRYGHEKPHGPLVACPHCGKPLQLPKDDKAH